MTSNSLRVRIHLNLGHPERAETAVRVQSPSGAWVCVAYATALTLKDCQPVVDLALADRVASGDSKKVPHAFLEGDLAGFTGRLRALAPAGLVDRVRPFLQEDLDHSGRGHAVNYNPRFARCFYLDAPDKSLIDQKLVACQKLDVDGWRFLAHAVACDPMVAGDFRDRSALEKTSMSEKVALARGRTTTARRMAPR